KAANDRLFVALPNTLHLSRRSLHVTLGHVRFHRLSRENRKQKPLAAHRVNLTFQCGLVETHLRRRRSKSQSKPTAPTETTTTPTFEACRDAVIFDSEILVRKAAISLCKAVVAASTFSRSLPAASAACDADCAARPRPAAAAACTR